MLVSGLLSYMTGAGKRFALVRSDSSGEMGCRDDPFNRWIPGSRPLELAGLHADPGNTRTEREFAPGVRRERNFIGSFWAVPAVEGMSLRAAPEGRKTVAQGKGASDGGH
jgi:hypothetical protein